MADGAYTHQAGPAASVAGVGLGKWVCLTHLFFPDSLKIKTYFSFLAKMCSKKI